MSICFEYGRKMMEEEYEKIKEKKPTAGYIN